MAVFGPGHQPVNPPRKAPDKQRTHTPGSARDSEVRIPPAAPRAACDDADMTRSELAARAARFKALNDAGGLRLPNAWDAASARLFQAAGFPAIGTTSA